MVSEHSETYWYDRKYYLSHTGWTEVDYDSSGVDGVWKDETWTYNRTATETIIHNHNVAAFNPIKISFLGEDTGSLTVNSVGNIVVDGQIKNTAGNTMIHSDGAILQGTNEWAEIRAEHLDLTAGDGIGTANRSIRTDLLDSGELSAITQTGNIHIEEIKGELIFNEITATAGDVNLKAESGMLGKDLSGSEALIKGVQVNLQVEHGGIGAADSAVEVDSAAVQSGGLNARAASDIYLVETEGDLFVSEVKSTGGDVSLRAEQGSLIDNNQVKTEDTRARADLLKMWDQMGLTGEEAEASAEQTVSAYERMKEQEYKTYWQYRMRFFEDDGTVRPYDPDCRVTLTETESTYYQNELGWTVSKIAALEDKMTTEYHQFYQDYGSLGNDYDPEWSYTATTAERATLTEGSSWTQGQLENSIGIGVLKEVSDTRIWIEDPNVVGRDIQLWANQGIGQDMTSEPFVVKLEGRKWSELSADEKLMILSAERKDIAFTAADEITIIPREAVDIQATGQVTATAAGNIYLGSEEDVNLATIISTSGDVRIKSRQSITNSAGPGVVNIVGADIILEAARGSIGADGDVVLIDIGNNTLTARAGDSIYLESADDDLNIDTIYAAHHVDLLSPQSIFNTTNPDQNIRAESLNLEARGGSIGTELRLLKVGLDPTGSLTANTPGDIFISSPLHSLNAGKITAGGNITFFAGSDVYVRSKEGGISTTLGSVLIDAGGSVFDGDGDTTSGITAQNIHFVVADAVGSAENDLEIDTLALGQLEVVGRTGVFLTETAGDIRIKAVESESGNVRLTAAGSIFANDPEADGNDIEAIGVELIAQNGSIGTESNGLTIDSSKTASGAVSISAVDSIYLTETDGDLNVGRVVSATGDLEVLSHGSIYDLSSGDTVNFEGGDITLTSQTGQIGSSEDRIVTAGSGITNILADKDIYLEERQDALDADFVISETGSVDLFAPDGSIRVDDLRAAEAVTLLTPYDIELGRIEAGSLGLTLTGEGRLLSVAEAYIAKEVSAYADNIEFSKLIHTGLEPLVISLGGGSKSMANVINVNASSDVGIAVEQIQAHFIRFAGDVEGLTFQKARVGTRADINNRYHTVIVDNVRKELFDCNLQLFPEDNPFYLYMGSDRQLITDADVVNYDPNYIINSFSTENSFVRLTSKMPEIIVLPEWVESYYTSSIQNHSNGSGQNGILTVGSDGVRSEEEEEVNGDD